MADVRETACGNPNCHKDREQRMVLDTARGFHCDPCIEPIVRALNDAGLKTVASCCGHGFRPGNIVLADGREIVIARDFDDARQIDRLFPTDINGETRAAGWRIVRPAALPSPVSVTLNDGVLQVAYHNDEDALAAMATITGAP